MESKNDPTPRHHKIETFASSNLLLSQNGDRNQTTSSKALLKLTHQTPSKESLEGKPRVIELVKPKQQFVLTNKENNNNLNTTEVKNSNKLITGLLELLNIAIIVSPVIKNAVTNNTDV